MIIDYTYNQSQRRFEVSYVTADGKKGIICQNIDRFPAWYRSDSPTNRKAPDGSYIRLGRTGRPGKFDMRYRIMSDPKLLNIVSGHDLPRLYAFDIEYEVALDEKGEPIYASADDPWSPINTISVCSPDLACMVLSTRPMSEEEEERARVLYDEHIASIKWYADEWAGPKPKFIYKSFPDERDMLTYFFREIVAKCPVLTGWNCVTFDWQYIMNRCSKYLMDVPVSDCSMTGNMRRKTVKDRFGRDFVCEMPVHTAIVDMMEVIEQDRTVMPVKESMSLDYISRESLGAGKVAYEGNLRNLSDTDWPAFVAYNAVDSVLVQMIDHRFRTFSLDCYLAMYCTEALSMARSKIALTEALFYNHFYDRGEFEPAKRPQEPESGGGLLGAYVRSPNAGRHNLVVCNDFASLYPSTIISTNMSPENYVGHYWLDGEISRYKAEPAKWVVIGPNVLENDGTALHPKPGRRVLCLIDEEALAPYRAEPDKWFVTVNGTVYRNDRDYAFRLIQERLMRERAEGKYLSKKLDAEASELFRTGEGGPEDFSPDVKVELGAIVGLDWTDPDAVRSANPVARAQAYRTLKARIEFLVGREQSIKTCMNSMYGGSSHEAFHWYNIDLANDITGEARALTMMMEDHLSGYMDRHWAGMAELHGRLGVRLRPDAPKEGLVKIIYGDTDSLYSTWEGLVNTIEGSDGWTEREKVDIVRRINEEFLDAHNEEFIREHYKARGGRSMHKFELETISVRGVWLQKKKKYAQLLMYKEGKWWDADAMPLKCKGLELVRSDTPGLARKELAGLIRTFLNAPGTNMVVSCTVNRVMQEALARWNAAPAIDVCASTKVNDYSKYVSIGPDGKPAFKSGCQGHLKGLAAYNYLIDNKLLPGENVYSGKVKMYYTRPGRRGGQKGFMCFPVGADTGLLTKMAPMWRSAMFEQYVLDPVNRILEDTGFSTLALDGYVQIPLF